MNKTWTMVLAAGVFGGALFVADVRGSWCRGADAPCGVEQPHAELGPWMVSSYSGPVGPHVTIAPAVITAASAVASSHP